MLLYNLDDVVKAFGNKTELAKATNLHPSAISKWGDEIPDSRQALIIRTMEAAPKYVKLKHNAMRASRLEMEASNVDAI